MYQKSTPDFKKLNLFIKAHKNDRMTLVLFHRTMQITSSK